MNAHRGRHSENRNRPTGLAGKTGRTNGLGFTGLARRSRLVPAYVVLTAAMILLCRPIAAAAADGEGKSTQRVVTDKSAGVVKITVGQTALSGIQPTRSVARPKQTLAVPTEPQDTSSSIGRAGGCVATNQGLLGSAGGSWSGSTTFSTDNFDASLLVGCGAPTNPGGRDEIFQFTVDATATWRFDTCTVPACWDTSLSLREEVGGGCPGQFMTCDEDGCDLCNYESAVSAFLPAGPTYYLIVDGWSSFQYGDFTVTYQNTGTPPGGCPGTDVGVLSSAGGNWTGSTTGSTDDFDASVLGCGDLAGGRDEIFQFIVQATGIWRFDTCTVPAGWDTTLSLRKEVGGGCPGEFIACDGDGCDVVYFESARSAFLATGSTYYLIVDGWSSFAYGDFTVTYQNLGPLPNGCPGRDIGVLSAAGGSWTGSTIGSTDDFDDRFINCVSNPGGRDEIFQFTVEAAGIWSFDTCTVLAGWDTNLSLRKETGGGCPGDFEACIDDNCVGAIYYESAFESFVDANTTYYLIVDGWSSFAYGDFEITYANVSGGCTSNDQCDDGVFCNGAEICDGAIGLCFFGEPPCQTLADCDEIEQTCTTDPCITWRAGRGSNLFVPQAGVCPDTATWVFDDIQVTHLRGDVLDSYTTPLLARSTPTGASPLGSTFLVNQAIWTVEEVTCNPLAIISGSTCTGVGTVDPGGSPAHDLPCSGTMPLLPNNSGDFGRCEVDFFIAFRTAENGAGMWIAGEEESIGGPGAADEFEVNVVWFEDCPPTGFFEPFQFGDDVNLPADFATAEVCQKQGFCDMKAVTGVVFGDADSVARLGFDQPGNCAIDAREPHSITNATARNGWDRMVLSFSCDPTSLGLSTGDFSVFTEPPNGLIGIGGVNVDNVGNTVTVTLTDKISPGAWTCISFPDTGARWCMGYLPADASQDGLSAAGDINALINSINLVPGLGLPPYATDINRSGETTGTDILRLIDLLNGAGSFSVWIAAALPPCPSE